MKLITFIGTGAFIVLSSFIMKKENATQSESLYENKWSLKKIHTGNTVPDIQSKAFIRFDQEKKRVGGNGGCNSFGGSLIVINNLISITHIFSTKMFCEETQQTEDAFFKQLEKVNRFEIKGKTLMLYRDKELLLEFVSE